MGEEKATGTYSQIDDKRSPDSTLVEYETSLTKTEPESLYNSRNSNRASFTGQWTYILKIGEEQRGSGRKQ